MPIVICFFTTYNNFLRPNSSLKWKTPVKLDELNDISNMPNKWIELLKLRYKYTDTYFLFTYIKIITLI